MSWPLVTIDSIKSTEKYSLVGGPFGSNLSGKHYVEDGVPVIRGGNLPDNRKFLFEDFVWVSEEKAGSLIQNMAYPGDVIFTQRGTLGQVGIISKDSGYKRFVVSQSQMKLTVNAEIALAEYVYYVFSSEGYKSVIKNHSITSGVPHINLGILKKMLIPLPPKKAQEHIVDTLKTYDDLIENNRRRIQLLEESARLLYKEWFVHLRFPGHEHVKITDGVPEGWAKEPLGDLLTLQRGFDLPSKDRKPGSIPIYASTGVNGFHNEAKVKRPGVVTGRSGSLGTVMFVPKDHWPLNTTLWVKEFKKITPIISTFILRSLKLESYNGGAAVPTLNRNDIHKIKVLCPPENLIREFDLQVAIVFEQIEKLHGYNEKLSEVRDILLPRLMNGELTV